PGPRGDAELALPPQHLLGRAPQAHGRSGLRQARVLRDVGGRDLPPRAPGRLPGAPRRARHRGDRRPARALGRRQARRQAGRGLLAPERIEAGLACLRKFAKLAERHGVDAIVAAATSAVREAENGGDFIVSAQERTGILIDVLPAREEARLIYLAAREAVEL